MDKIAAAFPKLPLRSLQPVLLFCFFLSGACGLIYEIAWLRVLGLIFGNTLFATSTVLAGYMAGLGIGALVLGKWIDQKGSPVKVYAWLEAGVGVYALSTPLLWWLIDFLHFHFYRTFAPSFMIASILKFVLAFLFLFIPTFLMGGTLPVLSKFFVTHDEETAKGVGLLYALNTFGAVVGVLLSGFILVQALGVWQTVVLTGILNFAIFYITYSYSFQSLDNAAEPVKEVTASISAPTHENNNSTLTSWALLILFGLSGAVSMMYEVSWTRVLAMSLGSSVYAFSLMLATFLMGLALGSYLFSFLSKYVPVNLSTFAILQILTALFGLWGMTFLKDMPYYFVQVFSWSKESLSLLQLGRFALSSLVMFPPTLCIGALFACFIHIYRKEKLIGQELGEAYFANTVGTIFGSALTGFWIIPLIGIEKTLLSAALINAAIGFVSLFLNPKLLRGKTLITMLSFAAVVIFSSVTMQPWDKGFIASDLAVKPMKAVGVSKKDLLDSMKERELLFYEDGLSSTVTVTRMRDNLSLAVNGKVDASNQDNFTQFFLGHLPMLLHPDPKNVLIIGLGSGSTTAAVAAYPAEKIHVVELEEAVIEAAYFFEKLNRNVFSEDPRVSLFVNDGRNFARVHPEQYDVIISEPSNPWMAGVANLFSYEHYQTVREKLKPKGIVCQWLHAYSMSPEDLQMVIKTFSLAFEHVSLWTSYYPDLMLIGTQEPLQIDFNNVKKKFEIAQLHEDLGPHGITTPESLFASFWIDDTNLRLLSEDGKVHRDNLPHLEFSAPKNLYKNTVKENFILLNSYRSSDFSFIQNLNPPAKQNAFFYQELSRSFISKRLYYQSQEMLLKAKELSPNDPQNLVLEGIIAYQDGNYNLAKGLLQKALLELPDSAEAHNFLGKVFERQNKLASAIQEFQQAADLEPTNAVYVSDLGNTFLKNEQTEPALPVFEKLIQLTPENFDAWVKRSNLIFQFGKPEEKIAAAEALFARYPRFSYASKWLGKILEESGRLEAALAAYEQFALMMPEESSSYIDLARISDQLGKPDQMRHYLKKAVEFSPELAQNPEILKVIKS